MKKIHCILLLFLVLSWTIAFSQKKKAAEKSVPPATEFAIDPLDHYITQIAAASALLELNETGEAKKFLDATDPHFRNWEWHFLKAQSDQSQFTLGGHTKGVVSIDFSPKAKLTASGSVDNNIKLWSLTSKVVNTISLGIAATNFQVSRDGNKMIVGNFASTDDPLFFALDKMQKRFSLKGHTAEVNALSISPNGTRLVTGSYDQTIRFWETQTGKCVLTIRNTPSIVYCISWMSNGNTLVYSMTEGQVRVLSSVGSSY